MIDLPSGVNWPQVVERAHEARRRSPKNTKELYFATAIMALLNHIGYEIREKHGPPRRAEQHPWVEVNKKLLAAAAEMKQEET